MACNDDEAEFHQRLLGSWRAEMQVISERVEQVNPDGTSSPVDREDNPAVTSGQAQSRGDGRGFEEFSRVLTNRYTAQDVCLVLRMCFEQAPWRSLNQPIRQSLGAKVMLQMPGAPSVRLADNERR